MHINSFGIMAKKITTPERKQSIIIHYDKLDNETKLLLLQKYPDGYKDYISRYPKPNGDVFFAVTLDTPTINYLVKVDVKIDTAFTEDDLEDVEGEDILPEMSNEAQVSLESIEDEFADESTSM